MTEVYGYVYVGYVITDYANACCMSRDCKKVKDELNKIKQKNRSADTYIEKYRIDRNNLIEFD